MPKWLELDLFGSTNRSCLSLADLKTKWLELDLCGSTKWFVFGFGWCDKLFEGVLLRGHDHTMRYK